MENTGSQIRSFTFCFRHPPTTEEEQNKCDGYSECDGTDDRPTTSPLPEQGRSKKKESPGERRVRPAGDHCLICNTPLIKEDAGDDTTTKMAPQATGIEENVPPVREIR